MPTSGPAHPNESLGPVVQPSVVERAAAQLLLVMAATVHPHPLLALASLLDIEAQDMREFLTVGAVSRGDIRSGRPTGHGHLKGEAPALASADAARVHATAPPAGRTRTTRTCTPPAPRRPTPADRR